MWKSEVRRRSEETDGGRMTTDNSTCHPSIYRGSGQAHTQYSKSTLSSLCHFSVSRDSGQTHTQYSKSALRVTMLPVFLLVASLASVEGLSKDPCLGYDVLCTTADYQFRRYNDSVWVGIHGSSVHNVKTDIAPLYLYLAGRNLEEMWIPYTGQFLVSLTGYRVLAIYNLLPEELWDNPPTATDTRVFVTRLPMMDVFARKIRWLLFSDVGDFNRTLTVQNVHVNNSNFFVYSCMRDSRVLQSLSQGQEIWFVSTGGFDCPAP
ncbi:uncharacterized protein [Hemitrygon akajei]|uniref:uncharacterized protein isoform X2 n=1 Tax=Hemitrygon akajei TaxID=2704970 RepID=UPI003BFA1AC9